MQLALGPAVVRLLLASSLLGLVAPAQGQLLENAKNFSRALALAPVPVDTSIHGTVDASIPPLLANLKREIRNWIAEELKAHPAQVDPGKLTEKWKAELREAGFLGAAKPGKNPFGRVLGLGVASVPNESGMLRVVISYDSFCSPDDSVLFFEHRADAGWRLLINFDNTDLEHQWGDRALVYAGISPRDGKGQFYAFIVRTRSYCPAGASSWNSINYQALRPTVSPETPKVVLAGEHGYREEGDLRVELTKEAATLEFWHRSTTNSMGRVFVLKYAIEDDTARRIEPVAVDAEGFVEEWLASPWSMAVKWSEGTNQRALLDWHQRLGSGKPFDADMMADYPFWQSCSPDGKLSQISFPKNHDGDGPKEGDVFFLVREIGERRFRIVNVATKSAAECGPAKAYVSHGEHLLPEWMNRRKDRIVEHER